MPRGPFGFRRLTSLGPLVEESDEYIYHFTKPEFSEEILSNGFERGYERVRELGSAPTIDSNRSLEISIDMFKPSSKSHIPDREGSTFFFPNKERPLSIHRSQTEQGSSPSGSFIIVVVDPDRIPCEGAMGDYSSVSELNQLFFEGDSDMAFNATNFNPISIDRDKLTDRYKRLASDYWETVELYDGYSDDDTEVWYDCSIPSDAVVAVVDPRNQ